MKNLKWLVISIALLISGCASTTAINKISLGMSKPNVISILGAPKDSRAKGQDEYLVYGLLHMRDIGCLAQPRRCEKEYFVRLQEGKVVSYGRVGDFDSTKTPEATINMTQP